jgi:hypothetical protein
MSTEPKYIDWETREAEEPIWDTEARTLQVNHSYATDYELSYNTEGEEHE